MITCPYQQDSTNIWTCYLGQTSIQNNQPIFFDHHPEHVAFFYFPLCSLFRTYQAVSAGLRSISFHAQLHAVLQFPLPTYDRCRQQRTDFTNLPETYQKRTRIEMPILKLHLSPQKAAKKDHLNRGHLLHPSRLPTPHSGPVRGEVFDLVDLLQSKSRKEPTELTRSAREGHHVLCSPTQVIAICVSLYQQTVWKSSIGSRFWVGRCAGEDED